VTTANIDGLTVRSEDGDFFAANPGEFCRHPNEVIFLFLMVGGQGISVHDDGRVSCVWHALANSGSILSTTAIPVDPR
jgi:hypothetical protein